MDSQPSKAFTMKAETLQQEIKEIDRELNRKNYNSPFQLRAFRKLRRKKQRELDRLPKPTPSPQLKLLWR